MDNCLSPRLHAPWFVVQGHLSIWQDTQVTLVAWSQEPLCCVRRERFVAIGGTANAKPSLDNVLSLVKNTTGDHSLRLKEEDRWCLMLWHCLVCDLLVDLGQSRLQRDA